MSRDDRYIRHLERTVSRLEAQNRDLLDRLMAVTGNVWTIPPAELQSLPTENGHESIRDPEQIV